MQKRFNILILSAGRRVELVKFAKESLSRHEIAGQVFTCDVRKTVPAAFFSDGHFTVPRIDSDGYVDAVIDCATACAADLIVPTLDLELRIVAENRKRLADETGALVNTSSAEAVDICRDKRKTMAFLAERGVPVPRVYGGIEEVEGYPVFVKPMNGSSGINAHRVEDEEGLRYFLRYVPDPIIQEFVSGEEYTLDVFSDFSAKPITVVPRKRISTRGGEIQNGCIEKNRAVIETGKRVAELVGLTGHTTIQCIMGKGISVIEINARFGGGAPMSMRAGADSFRNLYRVRCGEALQYNEDYMDGIYCIRFDDSVFHDTEGRRLDV